MYYWNEKNQVAGILLIYDDDDDYIQAYGQIKEAFRGLTKDDILQTYISDDDFRSLNAGVVELGFFVVSK